MTAFTEAGAPAHNIKSWNARKWCGAWIMVRRLQMSIAKDSLVKRFNIFFTHSNHAITLAVNRGLLVSTNRKENNKSEANPCLIWYILCRKGLWNQKEAVLSNRKSRRKRQTKLIIMNLGYFNKVALTNARAV